MKTFRNLTELFGLRPVHGLHDLDVPDEPVSWPPSLSGRPAVQGGEASTAGHPNQQRDEIRALLETADDILRDTLQDIVTRMSTIVREAAAVVELVQQLDPIPVGLVRASKVTDINSKRR